MHIRYVFITYVNDISLEYASEIIIEIRVLAIIHTVNIEGCIVRAWIDT